MSVGVSAGIAAAAEQSKPAAASIPYQSPNADEAAFVASLANIMYPADTYSSSGVECGLATYIDRHLAGAHGNDSGRYQYGSFRSRKPQLDMQVPR